MQKEPARPLHHDRQRRQIAATALFYYAEPLSYLVLLSQRLARTQRSTSMEREPPHAATGCRSARTSRLGDRLHPWRLSRWAGYWAMRRLSASIFRDLRRQRSCRMEAYCRSWSMIIVPNVLQICSPRRHQESWNTRHKLRCKRPGRRSGHDQFVTLRPDRRPRD
jgi:hypothetical protein